MKLLLLLLSSLSLFGCVSILKNPVEYHFLSEREEYENSRSYFYEILNEDHMSIYYENDRTGELIARTSQVCPEIPTGLISFKMSSVSLNKKIDITYENVRDGDKKPISSHYRIEVERCLNKNVSKYMDYLNEKN